MGLETAHAEVLGRLNKRMTLDQFATSANFLRRNGIDLRVFILVKPPYMAETEALKWAERSLEFAMEHGATAAVLIPTRAGNGAMEELQASGQFAPPALHILESAMEYGLGLTAGRVFADLWGLRESCNHCHAQRARRLQQMNLQQRVMDLNPMFAVPLVLVDLVIAGAGLRRQPDGDDCSPARAFGCPARTGYASPHDDWRIHHTTQQSSAREAM